MQDELPGGEGIEVTCECTAQFQAPKSLEGGMTNCPSCHKAVTVPGGPEVLFWIVPAFLALLVLGLSALLWVTAGPMEGVIAFVIGAVGITIFVVAS